MNRGGQGRGEAHKPPREAYDELGCSVCGAHVSSSFRRDPTTLQRLCNSCHCKAYRLKRKLGHSTARGGSGGASASQRPRLGDSPPPGLPTPQQLAMQLHMQAPMHGFGGGLGMDGGERCSGADPGVLWASAALPPSGPSLQSLHEGSEGEVQLPMGLQLGAELAGAGGSPHAAALDAGTLLPSPGGPGCSADTAGGGAAADGGRGGAAAAPAPLPDLQQRALAQSCASPGDAALLLACARRAQQATPGAADQRVVLGVLPSVQLHLPDDPPGLMHTTSVLLEAVAPPPACEAEQAGDSQDDAGARGAVHASPAAPVALRLTVFASAGAVACWHEAPACADLPLDFCPFTKAPTWQSGGPSGFSLRFPHAFCPQVDLMAASHRQVALLGALALRQRPTLSLHQPAAHGAAPPLPRHGSAPLLTDAAAGTQLPARLPPTAAPAPRRQQPAAQQRLPQPAQHSPAHCSVALHFEALPALSFGPLHSDPLLPHSGPHHHAMPCLSLFEL